MTPPPTPEQLETVAQTLAGWDEGRLGRAAAHLREGTRLGLETAHNLVTDVLTSMALSGVAPPVVLPLYNRGLMEQRIATYGAVGRPANMSPDRRYSR